MERSRNELLRRQSRLVRIEARFFEIQDFRVPVRSYRFRIRVLRFQIGPDRRRRRDRSFRQLNVRDQIAPDSPMSRLPFQRYGVCHRRRSHFDRCHGRISRIDSRSFQVFDLSFGGYRTVSCSELVDSGSGFLRSVQFHTPRCRQGRIFEQNSSGMRKPHYLDDEFLDEACQTRHRAGILRRARLSGCDYRILIERLGPDLFSLEFVQYLYEQRFFP